MNEIYLLVAVIATTVVAFYPGEKPILPIPTKCPKLNTGDAVHIAHKDCTKFYKCNWGKKVEMVCPFMNAEKDRLHFNALLQVCDWPSRAGCKGTTTPEPTTPEPTTPEPTTPEPTTPEPTTPTESTTPDDSWYTRSTTTNIPIIPTKCPKGSEGVRIPDKNDCKIYYVCHADGSYDTEECQDGLVFDPKLEMCDWDDGTICSPAEPTTPKGNEEPKKECPKVDNPTNPVYLPHECQCDRYYVCKGGEQIIQKCPKGQGFDIYKRKCVPLSEAECPKYDEGKKNDVISADKQHSSNKNIFLRLFHWDE